METHAFKAVFLSYASQDAEAARRIADALRAFGVEVWFDQSELRGGDAWDSKIKKQIRDCSLFVAVLSTHTSARREGYFRREWKLAIERTLDRDDDLPFLLPVVIDDIADEVAHVPEKFREVQWSRLPAAADVEGFCQRVKNLLADGSRPPISPPARPRGTGQETRGPRSKAVAKPRWLVPVALGIAASMALAFWQPWRKPAPPAAPANASAPVTRPVAPPTEVQKLLTRVWAIYEKQVDGTREEFALAEDLGAQAVKLEPNNAEAWAAYAQATLFHANFFDASGNRLGEARNRAERAVRLAPDSNEALFAQANVYRYQKQLATWSDAERTLRQLVERMPGDKRVLRVLA